MISESHYFDRLRPCVMFLLSLLSIGISTSSYGQNAEWIGGTSSNWTDGTNWLGGSVPADLDNVYVGVDNAVTNTTIDLGGTTSHLLLGNPPTAPAGFGFTGAAYAPIRFGAAGGATEYTIQNGTLEGLAAGLGYPAAHIDDNLTVNWNVSSVGPLNIFQVGGGSTLNIGSGLTTVDVNRFAVLNGGAAGTTATVNVNSENYAFGVAWIVGAGNASTVANTRTDKNTVVNVNASQSGGNPFILVGYTLPGSTSKLVIRNGATVSATNTAIIGIGGSSTPNDALAQAYVIVGDETTTGNLILTGSNRLRLGGANNTNLQTGAEGILDIVNGQVTLNGGGTVSLGYGTGSRVVAGSTGRIIVRENGVLRTQQNFREQFVDGDPPATGIMEFDGGTLIVDNGITEARALNLIDSAVELDILDGGMVLQISPAAAAVSNAGDFNADNFVDAADYTVWRNNLDGDETTVLPTGSGDGSGMVDPGDYDVWKAAYGNHVNPNVVVGSATINAALLGTGSGGLTVQGGGELILTGANTYVGDTVVDASTLSISSSYLADGADVALMGSAILDLAFAGTDTISQLLFDGVAQATGTWGAIGSGADNEDARFTGSGRLMVASAGAGGIGQSISAVPEPAAVTSVVLMLAMLGFRRPIRRRARICP